MKSFISTIDSNRFGFNIAKVNNLEILLKENIFQEFKKEGVKLIISRIFTEKINEINFLENKGFRIMDIQSTYRFDIDKYKIDLSFLNPDIIIRDAKDIDIMELTAISKESFEEYGHYFADNRLDNKVCREIYDDWIRRSIIDKNVADKVLVAEINGEIAGFLSFKIFEKNNMKFAAGGLGAVSNKFRNKNVFSTLTLHGLIWGDSIGLNWEEHNVLNTNYSVNRVFSKLGFTIRNSYLTLHNWID